MIVSAEEDPHSKDAEEVIARAQANDHVTHFRHSGGHALTAERFKRIMTYLESQAKSDQA